MTFDLKAAIAKQRATHEVVKQQSVKIVVGGELAEVVLDKLLPDDWDLLTQSNPERPGVSGDAVVGYNTRAVAKAYPHVSIDDEKLDAETWAELYSVIDSVHRNRIEVTVWGLNVNEALVELKALGKAGAGQK